MKEIDPKKAIETHERTADWPYQKEADYWYSVAKVMDRRFFNGLVYPDGKKVPTPVIAFDDLRNINTLACYDLFADEYGITGKITFNTEWYTDGKTTEGKVIKVWKLGKYSQGETLLHEYIHLWQQIGRGKDPFNQRKHGRNTHNKEFIAKAEELGIHPMPVVGCHTRIATAGSPIDILLREAGILRPAEDVQVPDGQKINWSDWLIGGGERPKGRSSLTKWICPTCNFAVRVGIKGDPELIHRPCGSVLVKADGQSHIIYKG